MRTIIPGPPGTGKTYRLVNYYLNIELNQNKIDPKNILYVSFSKAATREAKKESLNYIQWLRCKFIRYTHLAKCMLI